MILFKRVGDSFRKIEGREWALLFMETLGVLAGILIAFELQEWASRRNEAARHSQLMERLFEESERDVADLRYARDRMRRSLKTETDFAAALSNGKCPPQPLWTAVSTVNFYPAFEAPRDVYQELMGAGGLSSITDPVTRKEIANFNSKFEWSQVRMTISGLLLHVAAKSCRLTTGAFAWFSIRAPTSPKSPAMIGLHSAPTPRFATGWWMPHVTTLSPLAGTTE